jgi:hypothetical protein
MGEKYLGLFYWCCQRDDWGLRRVLKPDLLRLDRGKHAHSQIGTYQRKICRIVLDPDLLQRKNNGSVEH